MRDVHRGYLALGLGLAAAVEIPEVVARHSVFSAALRDARRRGKPLLNVGCPGRRPWRYPDQSADVCLDIDRTKLHYCRSPQPWLGDVRALPFVPGTFGAATCFHVLEHLPSVPDAVAALDQLQRVADRVYLLVPGRTLPATWHPEHRLWLDWQPGGYVVLDRESGATAFLPTRDAQPRTPSAV